MSPRAAGAKVKVLIRRLPVWTAGCRRPGRRAATGCGIGRDFSAENNSLTAIPDNPNLAYLAVIDVDGLGTCGGMLVVNGLGRPVEFHCSTPVRASRTQEVLYGRTLQQYLNCDLVGRAMLEHCRGGSTVLVVRQPELMALHSLTDRPLALIGSATAGDASVTSAAAESFTPPAGQILQLLGKAEDLERSEAALRRLAAVLPLEEPFGRIDEAIREAHAAGRRSQPAAGLSEAA